MSGDATGESGGARRSAAADKRLGETGEDSLGRTVLRDVVAEVGTFCHGCHHTLE